MIGNMLWARSGRTFLIVLLTSSIVSAQQASAARPNFAGHWLIDESLSQLDGAGGWFTNDCLITQTDKEITFASGGSGLGSGRSTFTTDGVEKKQQTSFGTTVQKSEWRGDRFVITTSTRTVTVSLDRNGLLIVDVTQSPPAGHFAAHSVYRKQ